jgi:extracellular factor (EF) 3-hydroxypalmitic acid methyl ester biosynthesis protein
MFHSHRLMSRVVYSNGPGQGTGVGGILSPSSKPPPASPAPAAEIHVVFQTAEGVILRGTPLHLNRHAVVWKLHHPGLAPRLSETLDQFKIIFQERTVYAGRAVISNLVDAGIDIVCDATLDEASWAGLDFTAPPAAGQLAQEFRKFLAEWQKLYQVAPEFKVIIADLQTFLTDLRLWLEQVELGMRAAPATHRQSLEQKVTGELAPAILPLLTNFFEKFENQLRRLAPEQLPGHQAFARRQLHPLLLCSPFLYRCFAKPLGYAGDYEMVNMMMREPLEGASLYAKIINLWFVRQPPAEAHRNRIQRLVKHIEEKAAQGARRGRPARILSVGCGPVHEVQQFLKDSHLADHAHFTLLDFNQETLDYCQNIVLEAQRKYGRHTRFAFVKKSVQQIVKESTRSGDAATQYDLIYCAGLFDYLSDAVCQRLTDIFYGWLAPGGRLVTTNVDVFNPRRLTMEHIMEWHLFYRRGTDLMALKPAAAATDWCTVKSDPTGVNIYFEAQKPDRE